MEVFTKLIPKNIKAEYKLNEKDFIRDSKLGFPKLITFILSLTASSNTRGVDVYSGQFFKNACRTGLWPDAEAVHRSTVTKARNKVTWKVFDDIADQSVKTAYDVWPERNEFKWHGMNVFAFDGSKYTLPASEELRLEFDPQSGLQYPGKGHYPQCQVHTAYDVFRRLPVARTVTSIHGSEREEALKMLPKIPKGNILLFDQGYPGFGFIKELMKYDGYFVMRCTAYHSFPALKTLVEGDEIEADIWIQPSRKYLESIPKIERSQQKPIKVRAIKLFSPDGTLSILLTNLFDRDEFPASEIQGLYFRRWMVEDHYRNEKVVMEIETFHSKTVNGILQELFAAVIMTNISRSLMIISKDLTDSKAVEPQFTNSINTLAREAFILAPIESEKSISIFKELLEEIARVKYYVSKVKRQSQPRLNKNPINKWSIAKSRPKK